MQLLKHESNEKEFSAIHLMEVNGAAYSRAYTFANDKKSFYLDSLSVSKEHRNKGLGTEMQEVRETIAKENGYKYVLLWVKKGTWMRKWYQRRGYNYYKPYKEEKAVWLRKLL